MLIDLTLLSVLMSGWLTSLDMAEFLLLEVMRTAYLNPISLTNTISFRRSSVCLFCCLRWMIPNSHFSVHSPTGGQGLNTCVQDAVSFPQYSILFGT